MRKIFFPLEQYFFLKRRRKNLQESSYIGIFFRSVVKAINFWKNTHLIRWQNWRPCILTTNDDNEKSFCTFVAWYSYNIPAKFQENRWHRIFSSGTLGIFCPIYLLSKYIAIFRFMNQYENYMFQLTRVLWAFEGQQQMK